jgi:hypothetical protein
MHIRPLICICLILTCSRSTSIAEGGSIQQAQKAFGPTGGHLITLLFDLTNLPREDVKTEPALAYTMLGHDVTFGTQVFPSPPEDRAAFVEWAGRLTVLLQEKKIKVCTCLLLIGTLSS